jgi:hypothetical protein
MRILATVIKMIVKDDEMEMAYSTHAWERSYADMLSS